MWVLWACKRAHSTAVTDSSTWKSCYLNKHWCICAVFEFLISFFFFLLWVNQMFVWSSVCSVEKMCFCHVDVRPLVWRLEAEGIVSEWTLLSQGLKHLVPWVVLWVLSSLFAVPFCMFFRCLFLKNWICCLQANFFVVFFFVGRSHLGFPTRLGQH